MSHQARSLRIGEARQADRGPICRTMGEFGHCRTNMYSVQWEYNLFGTENRTT